MILKRIVFFQLLFLIVFCQTESSTPEVTGQTITTGSVSLTTTVAYSAVTVDTTRSVNSTTTTVNSTTTIRTTIQPTTSLQVHSSSVIADSSTSLHTGQTITAGSVSLTTTVPYSAVVVLPTPPVPSNGALHAVLLFVDKMTVGEFEEKKTSFLVTVKAIVEAFCSQKNCEGGVENLKRNATTVKEVYIVSGYPREILYSPGNLLVAFFVSTGENKFLPKNTLLTIVQERKGNLSHALGKEITGASELTMNEIKATDPTEGTSLKARLLYIFFGAFGGVVLLLAVGVIMVCRIGKNGVKENDVRPLTISSLELTENQS